MDHPQNPHDNYSRNLHTAVNLIVVPAYQEHFKDPTNQVLVQAAADEAANALVVPYGTPNTLNLSNDITSRAGQYITGCQDILDFNHANPEIMAAAVAEAQQTVPEAAQAASQIRYHQTSYLEAYADRSTFAIPSPGVVREPGRTTQPGHTLMVLQATQHMLHQAIQQILSPRYQFTLDIPTLSKVTEMVRNTRVVGRLAKAAL